MTELEKLAARVEAEGPSRELDVEIALTQGWGCVMQDPEAGGEWYCWRKHYRSGEWIPLPAYTTSLDAAMQLVPEGCGIDLMRYWIGAVEHAVWRAVVTGGGVPAFPRFTGECSDVESPAAALCAAALRANQESQND